MKGKCLLGLGLLVRNCINFQVSLSYHHCFTFSQRVDGSFGNHCYSDRQQKISEVSYCLGRLLTHQMLKELMRSSLCFMAVFVGLFVEEY